MLFIDKTTSINTQDIAIEEIASFLTSKKNITEIISKALRQAFDEVIDGPRTGRFKIEQLEKTEKTYIGTKVEIILRNKLSLARGRVLDNFICGQEVDTKFSLSGGWMIPKEAVDQICILVKANDNTGLFSIGLLRTTLENLTTGKNQDGKRSISAKGKNNITWLLANESLPRNIMLTLPTEIRELILSPKSGVQRIRALFTNVTNQLIPRSVIEQVAQQKDALKRAREMKAILAASDYKLVCAAYIDDRKHFIDHGFENFNDDDWLCIKY